MHAQFSKSGLSAGRLAWAISLVVIAALALASCAPAQSNPVPVTAPSATAQPAMPTDTMAPTVAAATPAAPSAAVPASISLKVQDDAKLGKFLVDDKGMSLYLFTKDTPDTTTCMDKCLAAWPALLVAKGGSVTVTGGDASLIGTITRPDGSTQVTYNHWPLYYFAKDSMAGDMKGQGIGSVWFLIGPDGKGVGMSGSSSTGGSASSGQAPATVHLMVSSGSSMGKFLVDDKNMSLYLYTKDTPDTSTCMNGCLANWPALLVAKGGSVTVDGGDASLIGTITRPDGSTQVTYNHWPLYYFLKDTKAGDTMGEGVGSVWFLIGPDGKQVQKPSGSSGNDTGYGASISGYTK